MSLINQMLKDLEHRRAKDLEVNNGALQGINRYITTGSGGPSVLLPGVVIGLIVLLAILLGYLLWDKFVDQNTDEVVSITTLQQPVAMLKQQNIITKSKAINAKPKAAKKQAVIKKQPARPETKIVNSIKSLSPDRKNVSNINKTASKFVAQNQAGSNVVIKQNRKFTAKQQAGLLYQKAYTNLQAGQVRLAEEQLVKSINFDARYSRSRELLAGSYIRSGRYVEAGKLLKQGLKVEPKNYHFAKLYARVLMQQDKQKQAIDMLIRYRPALQADLEYFALIAALYQQTGQHNKAANMYKDLLNLKPDRGIWWVGLGVALEKTGKTSQAHQAYSTAKDSGSLNASMRRYTDNKLAAIKESGYPEPEPEYDQD